MKKLSTEITTKKGERKIITVEVDDIYADFIVRVRKFAVWSMSFA